MKTRDVIVACSGALLLSACQAGNSPTQPEVDATAPQSMTLVSGGAGKNVICHYDRDLDQYFRIEVSNSSLPAHLGHGDLRPGTDGLDEACQRATCVDRSGAVTWGGNGHAYEVVNAVGLITWGAARTAALALGGDLVTLTSSGESLFVEALAMAEYAGAISPWLGGFQPAGSAEPDGGWEWVSGEAFDFHPWAPGEPNDAGGEDLLIFWGGGTWNDWSDERGEISGYVVEWPVPACIPAEGGNAD